MSVTAVGSGVVPASEVPVQRVDQQIVEHHLAVVEQFPVQGLDPLPPESLPFGLDLREDAFGKARRRGADRPGNEPAGGAEAAVRIEQQVVAVGDDATGQQTLLHRGKELVHLFLPRQLRDVRPVLRRGVRDRTLTVLRGRLAQQRVSGAGMTDKVVVR
jgi:hypothetical protein